MAKRGSKQDVGAKQDATPFDYSQLEGSNIEQSKYEVSSTRPYATRPMTHDESEAIAYYFLKGAYRQIDLGRIARKWPKGENEALGREALIRIFANEKPFPEFLRQAFIDLLDLGNHEEPRKLVLEFRSQNWSRYLRQDGDIASYIEWHLQNQKMINPKRKSSLKLAVADARHIFGRKDRTIFHAWAAYRKRRPIDFGAVPNSA